MTHITPQDVAEMVGIRIPEEPETPLQRARRLELPVRPCHKGVKHKQHTYERETRQNGRAIKYVAWCPGKSY